MKRNLIAIAYTLAVLAVGAFLYWWITKNFSHAPRETAKKEILLKKSLDSVQSLLRKASLRDSALAYQLEIMREKQRKAIANEIILRSKYEAEKRSVFTPLADSSIEGELSRIR